MTQTFGQGCIFPTLSFKWLGKWSEIWDSADLKGIKLKGKQNCFNEYEMDCKKLPI